MKWPSSLTLIRHDTSAYNILKDKKAGDEFYKEFRLTWKKDALSEKTRALAQIVYERFSLGVGDANTPLADNEGKQAFKVGVELSSGVVPDVIFVSPYVRALLTLEHIKRGWKALEKVKTFQDYRIREQEHGLALIYNDWRVFEAIHPEQYKLRKLEGSYWYRYPQGENVPDVQLRNRDWISTLTREFAGKNVLVVTHHLNILALRLNLERLGEKEFIHFDSKEKPINCGVTLYQGNPDKGENGKLELKYYNKKLY